MKTKVCILILTCMMLNISMFSQIKFGLRAGLISSSINSNSFTTSGNIEVKSISDAKVGFEGGLMAQIALAGIFIQPEFLLTTTGGEIQLQDLNNKTAPATISKQNFTNLSIPVIIGPKLGPLRFGIGPVANILLSKPTDAFNFSTANVSSKFHSATFDYQIGAGLDLWKLAVDVKYQGNLSKLGNGMDIGRNTYKFDSRINQWIFGVGWYF